MTGFLGEYEATLDPKGRFLLPAGFKKQLPEDASNQFVLNRGLERCLYLYPMHEWLPLEERVKRLNDFDEKSRQFTRYFLSGLLLEMDGAGRLLIPKGFQAYAGLEKELVMVAASNKIEIWDKSKYNEFFENFSPESFSQLAQQVMGNKSDEPLL